MTCNNCGNQTGEQDAFCPFCGAPQRSQPVVLNQQPYSGVLAVKAKHDKKKGIIFIVCGVIAVIIIAALLLNGGSVVGTWETTDTQQTIVLTQEGRATFNYYQFNYEIKGDTFYFEDIYNPDANYVYKAKFKVHGNTMELELKEHTGIGGLFYGRSGWVTLRKIK